MKIETKAWIIFLLWSLFILSVGFIKGSLAWVHMCNLIWLLSLGGYLFFIKIKG